MKQFAAIKQTKNGKEVMRAYMASDASMDSTTP